MPPVKKPHHLLGKHYLREWREYRDLRQEDAADRASISRGLLSKIENSKSPYSQEQLERLASIYQTTPADLLSRDPSEPPRISIFDLAEDDADKVRAFVAALRIIRERDDGQEEVDQPKSSGSHMHERNQLKQRKN